jgi:peptidoglycan/LPS O-acetylase OafA/YrhL
LSQTSSNHPQNHFAALDGMRGIAALFVVAWHALEPLGMQGGIPHTRLAVDFFFLLSGFVVSHAYEARLLQSMSLKRFAIIRLIRLYPLILIGLTLGFMVFIIKIVAIEHRNFDIGAIIALIGGLLMVPTHTIKNEGWGNIYPFNDPTWSLFFEIFINIFYAVILPKLSKRILNIILVLSGSLVFLQAYQMGLIKGGNDWDTFFFGFGRVTFPFFCGVYLSRWKNIALGWTPPFFVIASLLAGAFVCPVGIIPVWIFESLLVIILFPALVVWGSRCKLPAKGTGICLFFGQISYPLYILHYPFMRLFSFVARRFSESHLLMDTVICAEIACQISFAFIAMKLFDEPVRKWLTQKYLSRT